MSDLSVVAPPFFTSFGLRLRPPFLDEVCWPTHTLGLTTGEHKNGSDDNRPVYPGVAATGAPHPPANPPDREGRRPLGEPIPYDLIRQIVSHRKKQNLAKLSAKAKKRKRTTKGV